MCFEADYALQSYAALVSGQSPEKLRVTPASRRNRLADSSRIFANPTLN
jgi:hypothetical protein